MKVNIQMFLPGSGRLSCFNYRVHTGMMIGLQPSPARGQITVHPQILVRYMPLRAQRVGLTGAAKTSSHGKEPLGRRQFKVRDLLMRAGTGHIQGLHRDSDELSRRLLTLELSCHSIKVLVICNSLDSLDPSVALLESHLLEISSKSLSILQIKRHLLFFYKM